MNEYSWTIYSWTIHNTYWLILSDIMHSSHPLLLLTIIESATFYQMFLSHCIAKAYLSRFSGTFRSKQAIVANHFHIFEFPFCVVTADKRARILPWFIIYVSRVQKIFCKMRSNKVAFIFGFIFILFKCLGNLLLALVGT